MNDKTMENLEKASTTKVVVYACEAAGILHPLSVIESIKDGETSVLNSIHVLCLGLKISCEAARSSATPPLNSEQEGSVKKIETFLDYLFTDSVFPNHQPQK